MRRRLLLALPLALTARPAAAADAERSALLDRLRGGGLVMLLRHARTVPGTGDPPGFRLGDCSTQRNLSDAGREQARAIGAALRAERVPVGRVLSSRWCRCLETARLLDVGEVEPYPPLDSFFADRGRAGEQTEAVRELLRGWRGGPGNLLLVTHQVNITALAGVYPASGELVAATPGLEVLGRLALA